MEEQNQKRFIAVAYRLYDAAEPETPIEEAPVDKPFVFIRFHIATGTGLWPIS